MSIDVSTRLFYGFPIDNNFDPMVYSFEEYGWLYYYAEKVHGVKEPVVTHIGWESAWDKWNDAISTILSNIPCKIIEYNHIYRTSYAVAISDSLIETYNELYEIKFVPVVIPQWNKDLEYFCASMGIPMQQPKLYIASMWS